MYFDQHLIRFGNDLRSALKAGLFPRTVEVPLVKLTQEGGIAVKLLNKTGATSLRGTLVEIDTGLDEAVKTGVINSTAITGVVYQSGIDDGFNMWVVVSGIAYVLMKDATAATRGQYVSTGTVAGRAEASATLPAQGQQVGNFIESKAGGKDVIVKAVISCK